MPRSVLPSARRLENSEIRTAAQAMNERIAMDPQVQHGKPVIRDTRVPVARMPGGLAGGMSFDEVCRKYDLTPEDIRAAIRYTEELVEQ
jgi:uncharacterized protein (DUF433 family)